MSLLERLRRQVNHWLACHHTYDWYLSPHPSGNAAWTVWKCRGCHEVQAIGPDAAPGGA